MIVLTKSGRVIATALLYLKQNRYLILEMTKRDIYDRYAGRAFGALWSLASPVLLMTIYVAVFTYLYNLRLGDLGDFPGSYASLLLSGLIPWLAMQEIFMRSTASFSSEPALVRQAAFPTGTLPIRTVLAAAPMVAAMTIFFLVYRFATADYPPITVPLVLVYWVVFAIFAIGVAFLLATLAVFFKDIAEILSLVFAGGLFLAPILFIPGLVPVWLGRMFYLNPFSYPIWVHKDIMFFGGIEHPVAWVLFGVETVFVLALGLGLYRRVATRIADVV